jgi:hypothetical protein
LNFFIFIYFKAIYSITYKDQICYWYSPDEVTLARNGKSFMKVLSFGKQKSNLFLTLQTAKSSVLSQYPVIFLVLSWC